ncbi:coiled-coil domain-containing protein 113 isoform X1 [Octopus bimaculoides]|nr:coiled-coil domain-containing protein 113 isoform X1 [Octopus bimaculoides]|eukprot:XP_014778145.1 PREDICTED: coiled-coil domain-containing protein 113-like [Octopus bimaculoides]
MVDRSETYSCSTATTNEAGDERLLEMNNEQLENLVKDLEEKNVVLEIETKMFEDFYEKQDLNSVMLNASNNTSSFGSTGEISRPIGRKRSKVRNTIDRTLRLTTNQKCDIAQKTVEKLKTEIKKSTDEAEKVVDTYKATSEQYELELSDLKKERMEFERDIVKGARNPDSKKTTAERVIRYFEDRFRAKDALIEKFRLKISTQRTQMKKLLLQLKQKEEMGEVLHAVDFNQLKIENQQYMEKIEERNHDLLHLKQEAGKTQQALNSIKKKLQELVTESKKLETEIKIQEDLQARIDAEFEQVTEQKLQAGKTNENLKEHLSDYQVPAVMDFVTESAKLRELQKMKKTWQRKVEIIKISYNSHQKKWLVLKKFSEEIQR